MLLTSTERNNEVAADFNQLWRKEQIVTISDPRKLDLELGRYLIANCDLSVDSYADYNRVIDRCAALASHASGLRGPVTSKLTCLDPHLGPQRRPKLFMCSPRNLFYSNSIQHVS
ncbi:hypothetical protein RRG08_045439 [Elysia crispata]|uniref:Uncharacterized protein n=1 Tax=Elysia crispata TaxID=231223 RepID=A0AAE1E5T1_9GAST|nr:hypothetical protein RRG08_045439 [Elysia crispata]